MKTTKKELASLIRESVLRSIKEMFDQNKHTFVFKDLEIGPLTVRFDITPHIPGTPEQPTEGGDIEIQGLLYNGKPVNPQLVARAETKLRKRMGEPTLTVDELMSMIQRRASEEGPDELEF